LTVYPFQPNIASNLGPQIDPKDIDTIEMQRGSYAADFGDRTYGVFNVAHALDLNAITKASWFWAWQFLQTDDQ